MGLMDFIKTQFIEIIEWTDDSRDTLSYRWPDDDKEIKNGAQLIVRESQTVQFMYLGAFGDTFAPGKHSLTTDNIPILSRIAGKFDGWEGRTVFKLENGQEWRQNEPGVVAVKAVVSPPVLLEKLYGGWRLYYEGVGWIRVVRIK